jgi:hypothetical protein
LNARTNRNDFLSSLMMKVGFEPRSTNMRFARVPDTSENGVAHYFHLLKTAEQFQRYATAPHRSARLPCRRCCLNPKGSAPRIWTLKISQFQKDLNSTAAAVRFEMAMIDHDTFGRLGV